MCRIYDFKEAEFKSAKRRRLHEKMAAKPLALKELRVANSIDQGDLEVKMSIASKHLEKGHRVKV